MLVAALWGGDFIFSQIGLASFPPLLFSALRFAGGARALRRAAADSVARHLEARVTLGLTLGAAGLSWLALARVEGFSALGFVIRLCAAMGQAGANFIQRAARGAPALSLVVWMSLAPIPSLLVFEGGEAILASLAGASLTGWLSVVYTAFGATALAYAIWGAMLAKPPAARRFWANGSARRPSSAQG